MATMVYDTLVSYELWQLWQLWQIYRCVGLKTTDISGADHLGGDQTFEKDAAAALNHFRQYGGFRCSFPFVN